MLKPTSLWHVLENCARRVARRPLILVGSDFDGTLCPIQDRPEDVVLDSRARQLLGRLAGLEGVFVGIFSGRALDDLARKVHIPGVFLAAVAGLETQDESGHRQRHVASEQVATAEFRESLREWCERFPGAWLEDKDVTVTIHYRAVAPERQPAFRAGARRRAAPFRSRVRLVHGKKVFEILPAAFGGKPEAVGRWAAQHPAAERLLFYFGDDANDEECYPAVRERSGISVAVGRVATKAEYGLASHAEVVWFLEWLEREVASRLSEPVAAGPV